MRTLVSLGIFSICGSILIATLSAACGSDTPDSAFVDPSTDDSGTGTSSGDPGHLGGGDGSTNGEAGAINLTPSDPVVTFTTGSPRPPCSSRRRTSTA